MQNPFKQHGAFGWCELTTNDVEAAKDFYTRLLGWTTEERVVQGQSYTVLKADGEAVGGIAPIPTDARDTTPRWGAYVTVDNVDATAKRAEELGATTVVPLTDIPGVGRFYVFEDPQGATIALITYFNM